jgi:DUF1009 family protein
MTTLGLIAGNGIFPLEVARMARQLGFRTVAVAHIGETQPELVRLADLVSWINVGQLQRIIDVFKTAGVEQAVMAGGISRARLQGNFAPDTRALTMLARLSRFSDDAVLRGVAAELESEGIKIIDPVPMLKGILASPGLLAGPEPSIAQMKDLSLAFDIARALGSFDVGQTVAVRDGIVAAVEAAEGTDATLQRAASVCGAGLVVAKAAKPSQDLRFDRPAIGPDTIDLLRDIKATVLGIEAGTTMLLQRELTLNRASACGISVFGYE